MIRMAGSELRFHSLFIIRMTGSGPLLRQLPTCYHYYRENCRICQSSKIFAGMLKREAAQEGKKKAVKKAPKRQKYYNKA